MYKIYYNKSDVAPYMVMYKTEAGFWQQVSPNYVHEHSCFKWAERNNKSLVKQAQQ